jgi:hypothetical protein
VFFVTHFSSASIRISFVWRLTAENTVYHVS